MATNAKEYLKEAASAVQALDSDVSATNGIWISTDDSEVINAVKREAPKYLPRINGDLILSVSFEPVDSTRFTTHSSEMVSARTFTSLPFSAVPIFRLDERDHAVSRLVLVST